MGKPNWQAEKQPAWIVAAIKKTIASLSGGYEEAAEWLGVTENALFNRLRADGDQIFPLGWAMVLQRAAGNTYIADAVSRHSNSVNVQLVDLSEVDNGDINGRLLESIEWIGQHSQFVRQAIADGVIDAEEKERIDENSYRVIQRWQEHITLLYRVYCEPEKVNAPGCSPERPGAIKSKCVEK